ncbi:tRNA uridine-5-carboxymethylaminomethyl(34) synthesis GTPase MnmE [uncultured Muribaculum sp.]|uniref:tRNA uridine-5-carboxymethylaminomethyl(34) synthesis GTPase MnmE n=1 Tax=uncultured Muribaculum sp. TaxID=1918613 RepID=UPI002598F464|nr:tRNA uridine-5-carboxymethylaminomethyl(34) synthesis GTPase MnmE [uncultured Muribaculum sp.]
MIHLTDDTICAVSTAPGVGGIAVIRVSGKDAIEIVNTIWRGKDLSHVGSHTAHLGDLLDDGGEVLDNAVVTVFRAPNSFTGEDVVEISIHGSVWIQRELVKLLINHGCRLAEPGEFTRRAFSAGKLDLAEAEAVADVIASSSRASHRIAVSQMKGKFSGHLARLREELMELASLLELELDFSEEDVEFASRDKLLEISGRIHEVVSGLSRSFGDGQALKIGVPVALVGVPNAGKSTLLNSLLGDERAIVSDIPGTTRDTVEELLEIDGVNFRIIDTAGLRETSDKVEQLGIDRAFKQIEQAKIVVLLVDPHQSDDEIATMLSEIEEKLNESATVIVAKNKNDEMDRTLDMPQKYSQVSISAKKGNGIDALKTLLIEASGVRQWESDKIVTNARHYEALVNADNSITRVIDGLANGISGDFIAQDVREATHYLGEITGEITTDQILSTIFSKFCIGK